MSFDGGVGAVPHEGNACTGRIEGVEFFRGEAGVFGSQELAEVGGVGSARDGDNPGVAGEDSGQGELYGGEVFACPAHWRTRERKGSLCLSASGVKRGRTARRSGRAKRLSGEKRPVR